LITSLDDFSRFILYAILIEKETSWEHILALEYILLNYGLPLHYYVDSHSVFRFVQGRDSYWRNHYRMTREVSPQWKQVLDDCQVEVIYALSPQAKGRLKGHIAGYRIGWYGNVPERELLILDWHR
jgi:hypothetical protein